MFSALFKRGVRAARSDSMPELAYQIACACGHSLSGSRGKVAVTVVCPKCKLPTLIFPGSQLANLRETIRNGLRSTSQPSMAATPSGPAVWRKPLLAAALALIGVVVVFLVLLKQFWHREPPSGDTSDKSNTERIVLGRQAIADLEFAKAAEHFREALAIARSKAGNGDGAVERWLSQMEKEATATVDLLEISLEEVLQKAGGLGERTWKEQFASRYADRTIIFDAWVRDVGGGVFRIDYPLSVAGMPIHVEVHHAVALRALKLQWPARMLVAIRLAEARRERGAWLVLGKSDGVVLFTEPAFFQASTVPVDAEVAEQLKRQAGWLNVTPP